jgi:hypothetical protein
VGFARRALGRQVSKGVSGKRAGAGAVPAVDRAIRGTGASMEPRPLEPPAPADALPPDAAGAAVAAWGIGGVLFLLARGAASLLGPAGDGLRRLPPALAILAVIGIVLPLGALKGRMVFQRNVAPRVVARALHLARRRRLAHVLLAPLFCLGLVHATRRRRTVGWTMLALIAGFIVVTRRLAQPVRGVVAASVALGLAWGAAAVLATAVRAFRGTPPAGSLDLPADRA